MYAPSHFKAHASRCSGSGIQCPICLNVYPSFIALRVHVSRSHTDLWRRCPICRREFRSAVAHYSKKSDDGHKTLWILTTPQRGRVKESPSIRRIVEKYSRLFNYVHGGVPHETLHKR